MENVIYALAAFCRHVMLKRKIRHNFRNMRILPSGGDRKIDQLRKDAVYPAAGFYNKKTRQN